LDSYKNVKQLADADQKRFELGSIMKIDATQAKVEAGTILNEVIQSTVDFKNALSQMFIFVSKRSPDTLYMPSGNVRNIERNFELQALIDFALENRSDLMVAVRNKQFSKNNLELTKANRVMDLDIGLANGSFSKITNIQEPTPSYNNLSFNIGIPLKFANRYVGDIKTAEYQILQSDLLYKNVELQIQVEVTQAFRQYLAAGQQVKQFDLGLLQEAKQVLDGKIYSYKRGQSSLLEVLNAQRTYNEVQLTYTHALHNYAAALVNLERTAGMWDIDL
jgi:cobalt-zinc-cadmium efflux system outer membrane protein